MKASKYIMYLMANGLKVSNGLKVLIVLVS